MFVDLNSSTTIAEKLGHVNFQPTFPCTGTRQIRPNKRVGQLRANVPVDNLAQGTRRVIRSARQAVCADHGLES